MRRTVCLAVVMLCGLPVLAQGSGGLTSARTRVAVAWSPSVNGPGLVRAMSTRPPYQFVTPALVVGEDSTLHLSGTRLYAVSRYSDAIPVVDTRTWSIERTYTLPAASQAFDIAVDDRRGCAYISRAETTRLLKLDLASGATTESVELAPLAGPAGTLEAGRLLIHERRLFVGLQRAPMGVSGIKPALAVLDLDTERLIDAEPDTPAIDPIVLAGTTPRGRMQVLGTPPQLYVMSAGDFLDQGGIEVVDLDRLKSLGLAVAEADEQTGNNLNAFVMTSPTSGYLTFSTDIVLSSHLHAFRPFGRVDARELHTALFYATAALAHEPATDTLYVPHSFDTYGVVVIDAAGGTRLTEQPTLTSGPVSDLLIIPRR